jgi:hypothetical protein
VNDLFGASVAVADDAVVIGAFGEDSAATGVGGNQHDNNAPDAGAAYVFTRSDVTWTQQAYLKVSTTGAGDWFGSSVAVSGDTVVVGAPNEDSAATGAGGNQNDNSAPDAGATYVFTRSGAAWTQQAYLKASNTETLDTFGASVAVAGDTIVIGAYGEDGAATGVGGNQNDNSVDRAGAAYVFTRSGAAWTQQAYLKASTTGAFNRFGSSVAVDGTTVIVGAHHEAGAAYGFTRRGATWRSQASINAAHTDVGDHFGWSVAVSGDTVVIGTLYEDSAATGVGGNQNDNSTLDAGAVYGFSLLQPLYLPRIAVAPAGAARSAPRLVGFSR